MGVVNLFVLISGVVFLLAIAGLHNYVTNFEDNGCEMTYMFEYPQYVKIALPPNVSNRFSRYALYAYGEGQFTENLRKMRFSGIPVLFIPGNSGSYKQVRSLASVSLRKGIKAHLPFHFDYFSADLHEEYSGLFGGILEDQTEFIYHCIHRILQLYIPGPTSPQSVVLIGHSMGGLVAKGLFLLPFFNTSLVQVIITLATPHKAPVLFLDRHLASYHSKVKAHWVSQKANDTGPLSHVTLVSIGGGQRDILVRSSLTIAEEADVSTISTAVPGVWLSTDHLSSLWCKELVLVIVRSLFDIVDIRTKQITYNPWERKYSFEYHLIKRTAGKRLGLSFHVQRIYFDPNANWLEYLRRQFSVVEPNGVSKVTYIMIRLLDDPKHEWLLAEVINEDANDWVFACNANMVYGSSRICGDGINLSNQTKLMPSSAHTRKIVHLHLAHYKKMGFTHVILRLLPSREPVHLNIDVHSSSRVINLPSLPFIFQFIRQNTFLESTDEAALYYSLVLPNFENIWQAYYLYISPYSCRLAHHHAVGVMHVPWNREDIFVKINELIERPMQLRLQNSRPLRYKGNGSVTVDLVLDPSCKYTLSLRGALLDSAGQLVRFHGPTLLAHVAAVLLLTLRAQLLGLSHDGTCPMFHSALTKGARPYFILPLVKMAIQVLSVGVLAKLVKSALLDFDPLTLSEDNLDFLLLPVILYMTGFAVAYVAALAVWVGIIFNGTAANKIALRFLAKTITGCLHWSEWVLTCLSSLPITAACILIGLAYTTCGALSLCVGGAFFFLKLCKIYEDYLQDVFKFSVYLLSKMKYKKKDKTKQTNNSKEETVDNKSKEIVEISPNLPSGIESEGEIPPSEVVHEIKEKEEVREESETSEGNSGSVEVALEQHSVNQSQESSNAVEKCVEEENAGNSGSDSNSSACEDTQGKERKRECPELGSLTVLHFNFTLLLLWIIVTIINIPSVLVWAHNYRFSSKLEPDPSFEVTIVLTICAGILWQKNAPNPCLKHYVVVGYILYALAAVTLIFSTISLHYISLFLMLGFCTVTIHQLFAGKVELSDSASIHDVPVEKKIVTKSGEKIKQL